MSSDSRISMPRGVAAAVGALLVVAGAGAAYLAMRASVVNQPDAAPTRAAADPDEQVRAAEQPVGPVVADDGTLPDVVVPLTDDAARKSGIVITQVTEGSSSSEIRLPGVVSPNAYRQVAVTSLVSGRIMRVAVELGGRVKRGDTMADIYSPQLAEAQTQYVSAKAMLDAHERELQRTQKLVEIGAASRQELERAHAEHASQTAAVESARSQLELLGVPSSRVGNLAPGQTASATTVVQAPIDGVVTERGANPGLNVDPSTKLFTVVDLATVWVVADVFERDLSRVRIGSEAAVTASGYPDRVIRGRVSYIDPQVSPETRTAKVRVEVSNPRDELRLGMYADVRVAGEAGAAKPMIPRGAVQNVGQRTVVYLVNPKQAGSFIEREVRLGRSQGDRVEVEQGLQVGDRVVSERSFFVRAERERLGLRPASGDSGP